MDYIGLIEDEDEDEDVPPAAAVQPWDDRVQYRKQGHGSNKITNVSLAETSDPFQEQVNLVKKIVEELHPNNNFIDYFCNNNTPRFPIEEPPSVVRINRREIQVEIDGVAHQMKTQYIYL